MIWACGIGQHSLGESSTEFGDNFHKVYSQTMSDEFLTQYAGFAALGLGYGWLFESVYLFIISLWCYFSHNLVLFARLPCTYIPLHDRHRKHCYSYNRTCQPSSCLSYSSSHRRGSIHRQQCQHIPCQPQGHSELTVTHQPALLSLIYMYEMSAVH